jgi:hypothetical protein
MCVNRVYIAQRTLQRIKYAGASRRRDTERHGFDRGFDGVDVRASHASALGKAMRPKR